MTLNGRMTVTTAVACVLVSSVLLPLFTNTLWFIIGVGAVIAVAGTGALTRLRTLPVSVCLAATVVGLLLSALTVLILLGRIWSEEALLHSQFGAEYDTYRARTWRLIPGLY